MPLPTTANARLAPLLARLADYKRKFYLNRLVRGGLLMAGGLLTAWLLVAVLEGLGHFGPGVRTALFYTIIGGGVGVAGYFVVWPLWQLLQPQRSMTDELAASQIGRFFPEVGDKLLNLIQLGRLAESDNALLEAAIKQKTQQLQPVPFVKAVPIEESRRAVPWLLFPLGALVLLGLFLPRFLSESTARILRYNEKFTPAAPFTFQFDDDTLQVFAGEPFAYHLRIEGRSLPERVELIREGNQRLLMLPERTPGKYSQTWEAVPEGTHTFHFEGSGFASRSYTLKAVRRASINTLSTRVTYPAYTGRVAETVPGSGALTLPEGSRLQLALQTQAATAATLTAPGGALTEFTLGRAGFSLATQPRLGGRYTVQARNAFGPSQEALLLDVEIVPDRAPVVELEHRRDSLRAGYYWLGGTATDDYGLTGNLALLYRLGTPNDIEKQPFRQRPLTGQGTGKVRGYLTGLDLAEDLQATPGQVVELCVQARDNDGVHGPKAGRSRIVRLQVETLRELEQERVEQTQQATQAMDAGLDKSKQLEKDIKAARERLMGKKNLGFQERKDLEQIVQQQQELDKQVQDLQKKLEELNRKDERLNQQQNEEIRQKSELLEKLLAEVMDEKTKQLYDELQKLLEEKRDDDRARDLLDKLQKQEQNVSRELDRALELFKQLAVEKKMDQTRADLEKLAQEQQKLADQMQNAPKNDEKQQKALDEKQAELQKQLEQAKEDMKALEEMNKGLEDPNQMPDTQQEQKEAGDKQQQARDQMGKKQNQKAAKSAREAADKMQDMADKMKEAEEAEEKEQTEENAEDLRKILENLLKLSFDQESLMKDFRGVNRLDPRFITMGQTQLKLRDDAGLIEDSLYALARRVFQIQSFVTREVGQMKGYMDESVEAFKARRPDIASGKGQLAMTSMNNLALLLNDALKQMQDQMKQQAQGKGKGGKPKKKGKGKQGEGQPGGKPSLGQMQQQLNQQIQNLQKSGKTGRGLSEELAKMAAQQEAVRRALEELEKEGGPGGKDQKGEKGSGTGGLKQQMEQTERDLVNKRLTEQTIMRQREILTRLLETEKALRERGQEERRESKTAKATPPSVPASFKEYIRAREKQAELLKTVSPTLTPFYRQEVERYFRNLAQTR